MNVEDRGHRTDVSLFDPAAGTDIEDAIVQAIGRAKRTGDPVNLVFNGDSLIVFPWSKASDILGEWNRMMERLAEYGRVARGEVS